MNVQTPPKSATNRRHKKNRYETCLHQLIELQVERTPDACAVRFAQDDVTYRELNARANRVARYLRSLGVGPDDVIGLVLERSIDLMVALLGVQKAGAAYLPLDPDYPAQRQLFILQDAGVSVVLTHRKWIEHLPAFEGTYFCLDRDEALLSSVAEHNLEGIAAQPSDLSYVIYTSGSTGQPKGCMISHAAICNRLLWMRDEYGFCAQDRVLQKTPYTFDVSVWELFLPLLSGACLVLARPGGHQDARYLIDLIQQEAITLCHFVPSMLRFFLGNRRVSECVTLRAVFTSGEALPFELVKGFIAALPGTRLHNLYGPTEAAVDVTYWECEERDDQKVPIGKAIDNIAIRILDAARKPVPQGEEGELYISGVGVGRGYLNRPELTAERFVDDPFGPPGAKMYRSGDRAKVLSDGNVEFLGRIDFQVKLRGLRIELGEIEAALREYPGVADAVAVVREEKSADPKLVAYVEAADRSLEAQKLKAFLADKLPKYMVPNVIARLELFPVTAHGKLDRAALPWPVGRETTPPAAAAEPDQRLPEIDDSIRQWMTSSLGVSRPTDTENLFDLGATSLTLMQLVENIENRYGVAVPVEIILDHPTVAAIVGYVRSQMSSGSRREQRHVVHREGERHRREPVPGAALEQLGASIGRIATDALSVTALDESDNLFDLGATSLTVLRLVEMVSAHTGVDVPVEVILDSPNVAAMTAYVEEALARRDHGDAGASALDEAAATSSVATSTDVVQLLESRLQPILLSRRAPVRRYVKSPVELSSLGKALGVLAQNEVDGRRRFLYPSAGDLYAVQAYLYVRPDVVSGLPSGTYYYHPVRHALVRVDQGPALDPGIFNKGDLPLVDSAAFALFLIGEMSAIEPIYKEASESLLEVEAGYVSQLLLNRQAEFGLGLTPLLHVDAGAVASQCRLSESQFAICALVGGGADASVWNEAGKIPREPGQALPVFAKASKRPRWSSGQALRQELIDQVHQEQRHLRSEQAGEFVVELDRYEACEADFRLRATQRSYETRPLERPQLSQLLSILRSPGDQGLELRPYAELLSADSIDILLYVKPGGVDGVRAGLHQYDPRRHAMHWLREPSPDELEACYTPFNRRHAKQAAFHLFLVTSERSRPVIDSVGRRQAGHVGQVLMECQAGMKLGLCPIGGMRVERWRDVLELESATLLHSFVGGYHEQAVPIDRALLQPRSRDEPIVDRSEPASKVFEGAATGDLAIVGVSGRYPGARTLNELWEKLSHGVSSFRPWPGIRGGDDNQNDAGGLSRQVEGGFLDDIDCFDSLLFNVSPMEARALDPQERLLLELTWQCLEDAGYTASSLQQRGDKVGVFVGAMWNDYQGYGIEDTAAAAPIQTAAVPSSLANRLSFYFDLKGPSVTFNTSCASAMTALHFACDSIRAKSCRAALVAGVNLVTHRHHLQLLDQLDFLSKDNVARPLGAGADGWVIGEGAGVLFIKPLADAVRDRDHIHGVLKGTAIAHSGRTFQFGAPDVAGRAESIQNALSAAGVSAESVGYIETAASGAGIADAAEVSAIKTVFSAGKRAAPPCYLGSIKGNIGHLESASGISQITKVLLQLRHRAIAPTLGCEPASPLIDLNGSDLAIVTTTVKWPELSQGPQTQPFRALVNVFGATGTAGHAVIEEAPIVTRPARQRIGSVVVPLSAVSAEQLTELAAQLLAFLKADVGGQPRIADIGFTLRTGRVPLRQRAAFIADGVDDLIAQLSAYLGARGNDEASHRSPASQHEIGAPARPNADVLVSDWLQGKPVCWDSLDEGDERRVSLPTYPFARARHWIRTRPAEPSVEPGRIDVMTAGADSGEREEIEDCLVSTFGQIAEIPRSQIDPMTSLENYGINSGMVHQLNHRLEEDFGSLPKTLFFEYRTLREVARYLAENRARRSSRVVGRTAPARQRMKSFHRHRRERMCARLRRMKPYAMTAASPSLVSQVGIRKRSTWTSSGAI